MKKLLLVVCLLTLNIMFAKSQSTTAQQVKETITVDVNDLDAATLAKVKAKATEEELKGKVAAYGQWVGIGREVGVAVDEGLTAVTKHATEIADTKIGKITMFIIAYKVIGKDIIRITVGIIIWLLLTIMFVISYFRNAMDRKMRSMKYDKDGKIISVEETIKSCSQESQWAHFCMYVVANLFICLLMFA